MSDISNRLREIADALDHQQFGPELEDELVTATKNACVLLSNNSRERGKALWDEIYNQCGGYMPAVAGLALRLAYTGATPDVAVQEPE